MAKLQTIAFHNPQDGFEMRTLALKKPKFGNYPISAGFAV